MDCTGRLSFVRQRGYADRVFVWKLEGPDDSEGDFGNGFTTSLIDRPGGQASVV
jgi:hypothetical protein